MNQLLFTPPRPLEIMIIVIVILVLFGGKKIPEFMSGLGKGISSFKKGLKDIEDDINSDPSSSTKEE
ncbi:MAG: twin-arginine translocase TatA/TatE family subunit [Bacteroidales bacterium]|nr:twin-arginine translocase TatA/TatE family subunit [Bacteroidales bacterium]